MHTPTQVTEAALAAYGAGACDCTVAIGGGSAIGLGKRSRFVPTRLKSSCRPPMPDRK
jgi:alcohol dehydrogenase class IV